MARNKMRDDDEKPDAPEPTPPPAEDPDKDLLRGGPGDAPADAPADAPPDQPSRARVKIGKKEFEVDPDMAADMAAAIEEREQDYMRGIQVDRRERDELERYRRAAQPTQPVEFDYNTQIFENPKATLDRLRGEIREEIRQEYRADQGLQRFWTDFYKDNPDLADEDLLVKSRFGWHDGNRFVRGTMFDEISELPPQQAKDALADSVRKEILRISRKARGGGPPTTPPTGRAVVEGATGDRPPQPPRASPDEEPASLSAEIRARARKRREAKSA